MALTPEQQARLCFPPPGLGRWARKLGLGSGQAQERIAVAASTAWLDP